MKKILLTLFVVSSAISVSAQCLTDQYHKIAKTLHPNIVQEEQAFNNSIAQISSSKRATKYIIPVVFHVIHTNGPENISKAQIENQIRILNQDFSLNNPNKTAIRSPFTSVAADCQIEFRLAQVDPSGNCTDGINRVYSPLHVDARDNVKSITGARWDYRKYLNIWVVSSIQDNSGSGGTTLGYAYLPSAVAGGMGNMDGIVMRSDCVGTIGTGNPTHAGRTLTHELGHYLGLYHTFEDGCGAYDGLTGDLCADTPPVAGTFTNANCPANGNSCNTEKPDLIDQWENYMDYSQGTCQSMFSNNQKTRMHNVITGYSFRSNLVSAANLIATGVNKSNVVPLAFFSSSARVVCAGDPVYYYDNSCKAQVTSKQWQFTGANISSTNKDTAVVTYTTPGFYKVTLTVTNANGSNTLNIDNYVEVKPRIAPNKPTVSQDFGKVDWNTNTGWRILDPTATKLTRDTTTGFRGNNSLFAPINSSVPAGMRFQLVTPQIDMRPLAGKSPKLSLMLAYIRQSATSNEEFRLYYSRGCSYNWTQFIYRGATALAYNSTFSPTFKPSASNQWKQLSFGLNSFEQDSNIAFMIELVSGSGNPIYIDEINIGQYNTDISAVESIKALNIFPNPSEGLLNISYEHNSGETEIWLENLQGQIIDTVLTPTQAEGQVQVQYHKNALINNGLYILKIRSNNQVINKKVIFAN